MKRRTFLNSLVALVAVPLSSRFVDTTEQLVFDSAEVQTVGGTFTLTLDGMTTRPIPFSASDEIISDAMREIGADPHV